MAVTFVVFAFIRLVKVKFRFKELFGEPRTDFISNVPKSAEHLRFVERFFWCPKNLQDITRKWPWRSPWNPNRKHVPRIPKRILKKKNDVPAASNLRGEHHVPKLSNKRQSVAPRILKSGWSPINQKLEETRRLIGAISQMKLMDPPPPIKILTGNLSKRHHNTLWMNNRSKTMAEWLFEDLVGCRSKSSYLDLGSWTEKMKIETSIFKHHWPFDDGQFTSSSNHPKKRRAKSETR